MEPPCCSPCRCVAIVSLVLLLLLRPPPTSSFGLAPEPAPAFSRTITVDQQGGGDFRCVQSAVDAVPDGNREWIRIHVKSGSYREKVTIPKEKRFILLEGDGSWNTDINFNDHAHADMNDLMRDGGKWSATAQSATFTVLANDFIARNISFKNMHNALDKVRPDQALAALVGGDRSAFHGCAFYGFQDTLCDLAGRHYFRDCFIKGGIDFIFGYGQSIYEGCTLVSDVPSWYGRQPGWVTAHARVHAGSPGGLVFKGGEVRGSGRLYLGRAWNQYATVVFYRVNMTDVVVPQGWDAWNSQNVSHVTFAEVGCIGPGSDTAGRVAWEKHLSDEEVQRFVDMKFIDDDGWLSSLPRL